MTVDRLREAARVLRERAQAAEHKRGWRVSVTTKVVGVVTNGAYGGEFTSRPRSKVRRDVEKRTAAYIATMHPGVGLALADWLDAQADTTCDCGMDEFALAVANLILATATQG